MFLHMTSWKPLSPFLSRLRTVRVLPPNITPYRSVIHETPWIFLTRSQILTFLKIYMSLFVQHLLTKIILDEKNTCYSEVFDIHAFKPIIIHLIYSSFDILWLMNLLTPTSSDLPSSRTHVCVKYSLFHKYYFFRVNTF